MQDRLASTEFRRSAAKLKAASVVNLWTATAEWFRALTPCTVVLTLLIGAIALYGYGYKVSQFHFQAHQTAHLPIAKALAEHRQDHLPSKIRTQRHRDRLQFDIEPDGQITSVRFSIPVESHQVHGIVALPRVLPFFDSALPLRSPPAIAA